MIGGVTRSTTGRYAANTDLRTWRSRVAEACLPVLGGAASAFDSLGFLPTRGMHAECGRRPGQVSEGAMTLPADVALSHPDVFISGDKQNAPRKPCRLQIRTRSCGYSSYAWTKGVGHDAGRIQGRDAGRRTVRADTGSPDFVPVWPK